MKVKKKSKAFSLIELSIVIIIIAILIAAIVSGGSLIKQARVTNAMMLTNSSHVAAIADLQVWVETSVPDAVKQGIDDGDAVTGWFGRASVSDTASNVTSGGADPVFCKWCVGGLHGIKFSEVTYLILPSKLKSIFSEDFVLYIVELPGQNKGYFINVEGATDNNSAIGYEDSTTMRFFDSTTTVPNISGTRMHMFMVSGGRKYYSVNGSDVIEFASNNEQLPVFRFATNDYNSFINSYLSKNINKVAANEGDYVLGRSDTSIAEIVIASAPSENRLSTYSDMIGSYLSKKYNLGTSSITPSDPEDSDPFGDSDGDGVPNSSDLCPDVYGDSYMGCPDSDGDGMNDYDDLCPDDYAQQNEGGSFDGCPYDEDGDGIPDHEDWCIMEPGPIENNGCPSDSVFESDDYDGDGVANDGEGEWWCKWQPGPVENNGCPYDRDGDGILDDIDECPKLQGPAQTNGCPDFDGDGIPNYADNCPLKPGPVDSDGCPDEDGDGLYPPYQDLCPLYPGPASNNGCP